MLMILNVMKVLQFLLDNKVDSINFKNAIIQSQLPFELPEFEKDVEEMVIKEYFGNDYFGNLVIQNYPNLQSIIVKRKSLMSLNSLKICNCAKLKTIEVESNVFYNVKKVIFESISDMIYSFVYLPNLQSFKAGNKAFKETAILYLSSIIIIMTFHDYIFLI